MKNPKADASSYILTALLQRLEQIHPGLIKDIHDGVKSDQAAIQDDILDYDYIQNIFDETFQILERASQT